MISRRDLLSAAIIVPLAPFIREESERDQKLIDYACKHQDKFGYIHRRALCDHRIPYWCVRTATCLYNGDLVVECFADSEKLAGIGFDISQLRKLQIMSFKTDNVDGWDVAYITLRAKSWLIRQYDGMGHFVGNIFYTDKLHFYRDFV